MKSRTAEFRSLSDEQLADQLADIYREIFKLRFQATTEKLASPRELRRLRKDIARVMTLQRERQLAAAKAN